MQDHSRSKGAKAAAAISASSNNPLAARSLDHLLAFGHDGSLLTSSDWSQDLFLMSHFVRTVAQTITVREDMSLMWRKAVYEDALRYPFLMHGMVGYAALHLSATASPTPEKKQFYALLCRHHLVLGVPEFRKVVASPEKDKACCTGPCLAMSVLLGGVSLATVSDNAPANIDGTVATINLETIIAFFVMVRGVMEFSPVVGNPSLENPYNVSIRDHSTVDYTTYAMPDAVKALYEALRQQVCPSLRLRDASCSPGHEGGGDPTSNMSDDEELYYFAIARLEDLHKEVLAHHERLEDYRTGRTAELKDNRFDYFFLPRFVGQIPYRFVKLLQARDASALLVLSQFIDVLGQVEDHWVLVNWSRNARRALQNDLTSPGSSPEGEMSNSGA